MQESRRKDDVADILQILRSRRWWIVAGFVVGAFAGVAVAMTAARQYRAEVLLEPVKRSNAGSGLQALAGQLGGIASLAGLEIGSGNDTAVAVATLKSHRLTAAYIEEENLLPILYSKNWDARTGRWKSSDPEKIPTIWSADRLFARKIREVTENRTTGLVTMTIEWTDPDMAANWARDLVARTNNFLRTEAYNNAQRNIDFLDKQLQVTNIVEVKQTLNRLLEEQWNKLMLAQGDSEYAFRTIDPAVAPKRPTNLPKVVVVLLWSAAGLLLSCLLAIGERIKFTDAVGRDG